MIRCQYCEQEHPSVMGCGEWASRQARDEETLMGSVIAAAGDHVASTFGSCPCQICYHYKKLNDWRVAHGRGDQLT